VLLAKVSVPVPLGQAFTYLVPPELAGELRPGARVLCDFGRRRVLGIVLELGEREPEVDPEKLKPIRAIVDKTPVLDDELLGFLRELARYYLAPIGEVMRLALPAVERSAAESLAEQGLLEKIELSTVGRLVQVAHALDPADPPKLRGPAAEIHARLKEAGPSPIAELEKHWRGARAILQRLARAGLVRIERAASAGDPMLGADVSRDVPPELNPAQQRAVDAILARLTRRERHGFLLHGVTASGKTEVYLRAVARCLELGRGAIVLVPEIALTPQLVARFRARLGDAIAVLHSGLGDRERHAMWKRLRTGELRVAVGARSALFAPVGDLGLICVDEEHDDSFKQEEGVRYHARDMALLRAHRAGAICVLGSATPSLGSEALAREGRLEKLELPERAHRAAVLPAVEIVDLRRVGAGPTGDRLISVRLFREIERVLEAREQAILFLNRRGFSPSLLCEACGKSWECPNCSVALTLHRTRGEKLVCHYCDYTSTPPKACDVCKSDRLTEEGAGTERIEHALTQAYPSARVARLDRDVAAGAKSARILDRMRRGEVDILVGTQMVTKGHDLPSVTLVGVLNADAALSMPDFRAAERTFHLVVQVAGRAGRGDAPGIVMIQTRQPDHPAVAFAARHDVRGFIENEMRDREELGYPPFARIALVRVDAADEARARDEARRLARVASGAAGSGVDVVGPAAAPIARLRNRWRFRFMVRSKDRQALRQTLLAVARAGHDRRTRVAIDVDPVSML
jgi:primosomal protein N' (replication factor Y) (superfamily II helicase)